MKIRTLAEEGNKRAVPVLKILDRYPKFLSTVLIGNNIVNLSASALMTTIALSTGLPWGVSAGTGILTFVVLLFGEIIPKTREGCINLCTHRSDSHDCTHAGDFYRG